MATADLAEDSRDCRDREHADRAPSYFLNGRFLETDGGTWRMLPVPTVILPDQEPPAGCVLAVHCLGGLTDWDLVLVGEGGYEGLAFVARATWTANGFDVHGYIIDTPAR